VLTGPADLTKVREALAKSGFKPELAEVTQKSLNETEMAGDDALKMQKLIDALESLDDVQDVFTSAVFDEA
jgi:transcriptional/translational regulatory protein YebC/TACO1